MRLLRRSIVIPALAVILLAIVAVYVVVSFVIVDNLVSGERNPQEDHPDTYGLAYEDVEFPARGETLRLSGWYLPASPDAAHVILVHGLDSVRSGDNMMELADRLVRHGYNVLTFDLRGHGSSEDGLVSGGYYERQDVWGAYDYLTEQREASPGAVGLVGFSMGAASAILSAVEEPGISAVVADSPYAAADELIAREAARSSPFPEWLTPMFVPGAKALANWRYGIKIGALEPENAVGRLGYPTLVIHGEADARIPFNHGMRVAAAGQPGTELWSVPGVEHVEALATHPDEYGERVTEYLDSRLR